MQKWRKFAKSGHNVTILFLKQSHLARIRTDRSNLIHSTLSLNKRIAVIKIWLNWGVVLLAHFLHNLKCGWMDDRATGCFTDTRSPPPRPTPNDDNKCFYIKWANPASFSIYFGLFKHSLQILQQIGMRKLSIQDMVQGYKLKWVSSHNHLTRAPTHHKNV